MRASTRTAVAATLTGCLLLAACGEPADEVGADTCPAIARASAELLVDAVDTYAALAVEAEGFAPGEAAEDGDVGAEVADEPAEAGPVDPLADADPTPPAVPDDVGDANDPWAVIVALDEHSGGELQAHRVRAEQLRQAQDQLECGAEGWANVRVGEELREVYADRYVPITPEVLTGPALTAMGVMDVVHRRLTGESIRER